MSDIEDEGFVLVQAPGKKYDTTSEPPPQYLTRIDQFIHSLESVLWPLNIFIHDNPELGYQESKAHDALTNFMRSRHGWAVTPSAFGLQTAWKAVFDSNKPGPVVSFNVEMDALPNLGHACGHNLIAMSGVAAGLATADVMRSQNLGGKVIVIGTPAEEGGGGKIKCLEAGAYKNVDVSIISHPGILNNSPMVRTTAFISIKVAYHGKAAHAAKSPWLGINALDALVIAYNSISTLRQQTRPDDVIGLQITNGGSRTNIIHEYASGVAVLRATSSGRLQELQRKVEACFRAGAEATGATVEIDIIPGYKDHVPNRVLADSYRKYWLALPDISNPPLPAEGQFTWVPSSTDQGNLSYELPSMNVSFAIPPGPEGGQPHSPDFEVASRTKPAFQRAMRVAKGMAGAAVDVLSTPGLLDNIKRQWREDMEKQNASS